MNHHINGVTCALCDEKIITMDPILQEVARWVKMRFPDRHFSWGWRDEAAQTDLFQRGLTRATFPHSAHNTLQDGKPCAQAFDLFRIRPDRVASFKLPECFEVWQALELESPHGSVVEWSGHWTGRFRECDHFQLKSWKGRASS